MTAKIQATPAGKRRPGKEVCTQTNAPSRRTGQINAQAASDPVDTNSTCQYARNNFNGNYWYTRQDSCFVIGRTYFLYDLDTGARLAEIDADVTLLNYVSNGINWGGQFKFVVNRADPAMAGTTLSAAPTCNGNCAAGAGRFTNQDISTVGTIVRANPTYTMNRFTNGQGSGSTKWVGSAFIPGASTGTQTQPFDDAANSYPTVRCDLGTLGISGTGCVYPAYTPTLTYSRAILGQLAQHVADAQASGLPGAPGGTPLNRLNTSLDDGKDNRDTACPASLPRPFDANGVQLQCDEYPFAASKQGANSTGGSGGRTFSYCQITAYRQGVTGPGFSACMIDAQSNQSGGGSLGAFYKSQRVLWDDAYYVQVTA